MAVCVVLCIKSFAEHILYDTWTHSGTVLYTDISCQIWRTYCTALYPRLS